jgi:hypothetical protein
MKKIYLAVIAFCLVAGIRAQQPAGTKLKPSGKAIEAKKCKKEKVPFAEAKHADKVNTEQKTLKLYTEAHTAR